MTQEELIKDYIRKIKYYIKLIQPEEGTIIPKDTSLLIIPEEARSDKSNI